MATTIGNVAYADFCSLVRKHFFEPVLKLVNDESRDDPLTKADFEAVLNWPAPIPSSLMGTSEKGSIKALKHGTMDMPNTCPEIKYKDTPRAAPCGAPVPPGATCCKPCAKRLSKPAVAKETKKKPSSSKSAPEEEIEVTPMTEEEFIETLVVVDEKKNLYKDDTYNFAVLYKPGKSPKISGSLAEGLTKPRALKDSEMLIAEKVGIEVDKTLMPKETPKKIGSNIIEPPPKAKKASTVKSGGETTDYESATEDAAPKKKKVIKKPKANEGDATEYESAIDSDVEEVPKAKKIKASKPPIVEDVDPTPTNKPKNKPTPPPMPMISESEDEREIDEDADTDVEDEDYKPQNLPEMNEEDIGHNSGDDDDEEEQSAPPPSKKSEFRPKTTIPDSDVKRDAPVLQSATKKLPALPGVKAKK